MLGEDSSFTSDRDLAQIRSDLDQVSDRSGVYRVVVSVDSDVVVARQADLRVCGGERWNRRQRQRRRSTEGHQICWTTADPEDHPRIRYREPVGQLGVEVVG